MKQLVSSGETGASREPGRYKTAVLQKALDVLEVVAFARPGLSLQEVSDRAGLPRATAFRLLANLVERGYVARSEAGSYSLGSRARLLGSLRQDQAQIRAEALPHMRDLRDRHGHTVSLAVRVGHQLLYLETVEGTQALRFVEPAGATGPLHATALGKALLAWCAPTEQDGVLSDLQLERYTESTITSREAFRAELGHVHSRGFAVDNEESVGGARCVAAPVLDAGGTASAAMSVSAPIAALDWSEVAIVASEVQQACREISERIKEATRM